MREEKKEKERERDQKGSAVELVKRAGRKKEEK